MSSWLTVGDPKLMSSSIWSWYVAAPGTGFQSRTASVTVPAFGGLIRSAAARPWIVNEVGVAYPVKMLVPIWARTRA